MEHKGGFLPFELELTELVVPGETLLLTVAADNRISHSTLPVGNEGGTAFFGSDNPGVPSVEAARYGENRAIFPILTFLTMQESTVRYGCIQHLFPASAV